MENSNLLEVKCEDFLKDNPRLYAHKARRKKIAMVHLEVVSRDAGKVRLLLGESRLIIGERGFEAESSSTLIRKLSEFTWDMAVFLILDFHPILSFVDFLILITGPLYNWRLKRTLRLLSNGEVTVNPGESKKALLGFRKVPKGIAQLQLFWYDAKGNKQELVCNIG